MAERMRERPSVQIGDDLLVSSGERRWTRFTVGSIIWPPDVISDGAESWVVVSENGNAHQLADCRLPVCSCSGTRWVDDEGWDPYPYGYVKEVIRSEWDGLVPCGWCNHGGPEDLAEPEDLGEIIEEPT